MYNVQVVQNSSLHSALTATENHPHRPELSALLLENGTYSLPCVPALTQAWGQSWHSMNQILISLNSSLQNTVTYSLCHARGNNFSLIWTWYPEHKEPMRKQENSESTEGSCGHSTRVTEKSHNTWYDI